MNSLFKNHLNIYNLYIIMSSKNEIYLKLFCKLCNKMYTSPSSLCNHNKKFHNNIQDTINISNDKCNQSVDKSNQYIEKSYKCNNCNKIYKHAQSKYKHQLSCKFKNNIIQPIAENTELIKLKKENEVFKNTILNILQQAKIHPKTLQLINNNNSINNILDNNEILDNNLNINNEFINFTQNTITFNDKHIKFFFITNKFI